MPERYVAVGGSTVISSPDGQTWNARSVPGLSDATFVTWINSQYIILAGTKLYSSIDGVFWYPYPIPYAGSGIDYDGSKYVLGTAGGLYTSPNLTDWTYRFNSISSFVLCRNSMWVSMESSGDVYSSPDGINWTYRTSIGPPQSLNYANGTWLALSWDNISTSVDGISWANTHINSMRVYQPSTYEPVSHRWFSPAWDGSTENIYTTTPSEWHSMSEAVGAQRTIACEIYDGRVWLACGLDGILGSEDRKIWTYRYAGALRWICRGNAIYDVRVVTQPSVASIYNTTYKVLHSTSYIAYYTEYTMSSGAMIAIHRRASTGCACAIQNTTYHNKTSITRIKSNVSKNITSRCKILSLKQLTSISRIRLHHTATMTGVSKIKAALDHITGNSKIIKRTTPSITGALNVTTLPGLMFGWTTNAFYWSQVCGSINNSTPNAQDTIQISEILQTGFYYPPQFTQVNLFVEYPTYPPPYYIEIGYEQMGVYGITGGNVTPYARNDFSFSGNTVTTAAGDFIAAGFQPGMYIVVNGWWDNLTMTHITNRSYQIANVAQRTITITGTFTNVPAGNLRIISVPYTLTVYRGYNNTPVSAHKTGDIVSRAMMTQMYRNDTGGWSLYLVNYNLSQALMNDLYNGVVYTQVTTTSTNPAVATASPVNFQLPAFGGSNPGYTFVSYNTTGSTTITLNGSISWRGAVIPVQPIEITITVF